MIFDYCIHSGLLVHFFPDINDSLIHNDSGARFTKTARSSYTAYNALANVNSSYILAGILLQEFTRYFNL